MRMQIERLAAMQFRALSRYYSSRRRRHRPGLDPARGTLNGFVIGAVLWVGIFLLTLLVLR